MTIIKGLVLSLAVAILIFFFELAFIPGHLYSPNYHDDHHDYEESSNAHVLWLYPVVAISYFAASSWTSEVATTAYKMKHGRGQSMAALVTSPNTRRRIFLESFRLILIANYLGFAIGLQWIPWIGRTLSFFFVSFVDAYYCFDGVLATRGWSVEKRLRFVESRWAYMASIRSRVVIPSGIDTDPIVTSPADDLWPHPNARLLLPPLRSPQPLPLHGSLPLLHRPSPHGSTST